jgi:Ion channel
LRRSSRLQQTIVLAAAALTAAALLVALRSAGLARRWQRPADTLILVGIAATAAIIIANGYVTDPGSGAKTPPVLALVLSVLAPIVVVRRLLTHRRVRRSTLLGAIAVYLLIPIAFFYVFYTIDVLQPTAFFGQVEPTSSFMYFSLTTVTTVGYGDLVAVSQPGRLMANFEAVIGQVYLVTFVGLLIGLLTQQNREA